MSVMILWRKRDAAPVIECDACHKQIDDVHLAMYVFDQAEAKDGARSTMYFVHKGACWKILEGKMKSIGDIELSALPDFLCHNLAISPRDSAESAHLGGAEDCRFFSDDPGESEMT